MRRIFRLMSLAVCLALPFAYNTLAQSRAAATVYICPMHSEVKSSKPGHCPRCNMALVAHSQARKKAGKRRPANGGRRASGAKSRATKISKPTLAEPTTSLASLSVAERMKLIEKLAPTYELTCPMHTEVRQAQEGVCPRCGMPLVAVKPSISGEYNLKVISTPARPKANEKVRLRFSISQPGTGAPVKSFVMNNERLFHLFIVSRDLTEYQHIHPQLEPDGSFIVETVLPRAGLYKLHSDFFPAGGTPQVIQRDLLTSGYIARKQSAAATIAPLAPDATLTKTIDGMKISLDLDDSQLFEGALVPLRYRLANASTGEPVRDLEPYLGAWGHTLILNADQSEYLHSHPTEMLTNIESDAVQHGGPEVEFKTMFPRAGDYRIWTQFQRMGKVTTVSFTVRVRPAT
jgi:hypothetical protein